MTHPPLSAAQVEQFQRDGFLVCPQFFDEGQHRQLVAGVEEVSAWADSGPWAHYREQTDRGPVLTRTERFLDSHPRLNGLLGEGRLLTALEQLFGEPACVFKDKINYKLPGGAGFHPHQDAAAYHPFGSLHITCLAAIDANTEANGCLWFAAGEHQAGLLPPNEQGCLAEETAGQMRWAPAPLAPGGVVFFSSYAPHRSSPNRSPQPRRSLYVTYGKQSEGNLRDAYYEDRRLQMTTRDGGGDDSLRVSTIGHFQGRPVEET